MYIQITIDGPSGVGKSTLSNFLAKSLGFLSVNTGIIFRGLAWYFLKNNISDEQIPEVLNSLKEKKNFYFDKNIWFLNDKPISEKELINSEISKKSSKIATYPEIREYVMHIERDVATRYNIVIEGRDIGTNIFPNAILKIFLTADPKIRSQRRYQELKSKNLLPENATQEDIYKEILKRDKNDATRKLSPLKIPENAVIMCNNNKSIEELTQEIKKILEIRLQNLR